jgi:hypothetical protein
MLCCSRPLGVLRSVICLALLGFAVTVLIGPVLAVVGFLLPFALIGALAWVCYRFGRGLIQRVVRRRRARLVLVDAPPAHVEEPVVLQTVAEDKVVPRPPSRLRSLARSSLHVAVEVCCGAALGAALAVVADWQTGAGIEHVALGAAIGAVVGFVVGGSRSQPAIEGGIESAKANSQAA